MSRQRFIFSLSAVVAAVLLIVAAAAFGPGAVRGVGLGIGIAGTAVSSVFGALLVHQRRPAGHPELRLFGHALGLWAALAGATASVATWEIVGTAVFAPGVSRWLTLANGLIIALLGCTGLVAQELCTERVVHVLEVVQRPWEENVAD